MLQRRLFFFIVLMAGAAFAATLSFGNGAIAQNADTNVEHIISNEGPADAQFSSLCTENGDCTTCDFIVLGLRIVYWLFSVIGSLSVLMFVASGFALLVSRGDTTIIDKGKAIIQGSLIGIALALVSFGLVNLAVNAFLNPPQAQTGVVGKIFTTQNWNEFSCPDYQHPVQATPSSTPTTPLTPPSQSTVPEGEYTEAEARDRLGECGVEVNNDPCREGQSSGCTNLDGMRTDTLEIACSIAGLCDLHDVVVTGGTDDAHSSGTYSHGSGYKIDIDDSADVTDCIVNNPSRFRLKSTRSGDRVYCDVVTGDEWVKESNHFDVKSNDAPSSYCDAA